MTKLALKIDHLLIQYPGIKDLFTAVNGVSFEIAAGEFFGLLGPNGAGKTSIISAIVSLISTQGGSIEIFGCRPGSKEAKRAIGYVPQEIIGYGFFDVNEVLQFNSGYFGIRNNQKKIDELLDRLQLMSSKFKKVNQLSGGLKRRLMIAKALLHDPKILVLDEPSAGVDVELRNILWAFTEDLNKHGTTILLTTHYLEEAQRLCKRVAIMDHGSMLAIGETGKLVSSLAERNMRLRLKSNRLMGSDHLRERPEQGLLSVTQLDKALEVRVVGDLGLSEILSMLDVPASEIVDIRTEEAKLEQAFLKLIKKGNQK